jgi:CheY-like chemotaxis protein
LKNDPETANIPIIALVSKGDSGTRKKAQEIGANDVVQFPSAAEALSSVFRKYFC